MSCSTAMAARHRLSWSAVSCTTYRRTSSNNLPRPLTHEPPAAHGGRGFLHAGNRGVKANEWKKCTRAFGPNRLQSLLGVLCLSYRHKPTTEPRKVTPCPVSQQMLGSSPVSAVPMNANAPSFATHNATPSACSVVHCEPATRHTRRPGARVRDADYSSATPQADRAGRDVPSRRCIWRVANLSHRRHASARHDSRCRPLHMASRLVRSQHAPARTKRRIQHSTRDLRCRTSRFEHALGCHRQAAHRTAQLTSQRVIHRVIHTL